MRIFAAIAISLCMLASGAQSQTSTDQETIRITRSGSQPPRPGPADNFTGSVRVDSSFQANAPARMYGARVAFEPGARTAWHTHPLGQISDRDNGHRPGAALGRSCRRNPAGGRGLDSARSEALARGRAEQFDGAHRHQPNSSTARPSNGWRRSAMRSTARRSALRERAPTPARSLGRLKERSATLPPNWPS